MRLLNDLTCPFAEGASGNDVQQRVAVYSSFLQDARAVVSFTLLSIS